MTKIEFVCFGGQDEKDKVCDALIIDEDIYILGCGISCPSTIALGIKKIIPDFNYLIDNKQKIKGIFIPTASYELFGGLQFLLKLIPNLPIYTSSLGQTIINNFLERIFNNKNIKNHEIDSFKNKYNVNVLSPLSINKIGKIDVMAFRTACFMPQSLGFIFKTNVGSIIYVDNFIIPTNANAALYDLLNEVNKFTNNNVLALITSIGHNINNQNFTTPNYSVSSFFENCIIEMPHRGIFAIDEQDIYKLLRLAWLADKMMIPFYIYSGSLAHAFNYILHNRIINFPHLLYIDKNQLNNVDRCIIVVASDKQNLLNRLQKIAAQEDDKLILKSSDTFVYSLLTTPGYEKLEANLFDNLNRFGIAKIAKLPKNVIMLSQSQEDHKFLINILKPKYIFPINGLYMDFVKYKKIAKTCFNNNTIILNNGQKAIFDDDKLINIKQHLKIIEQYVGTNGLYDVGANGLIECEQMSDSGCVLASLLIDKKTKQIKCSNYNIVGIINTNDSKNQSIINEINSTLDTAMLDLLNQRNSDANLTREEQDYFKKQIAKQYDKKFDKRPLVLLSIIYNDQLQKS